jgi:AcrR family transcriptional regulator
MTFKEVANVTGMTRQNLYYYYDSKESVLQDVIDQFFDGLYQKMMCFKQSNTGYHDPSAFIEALIRELAQALIEDIETARTFLTKEVEHIFVDRQIGFTKRILGSIVREQGIVVNDPQYIHYLALQMTGAMHFSIKEWVMSDMSFPLEKFVSLASPVFDRMIPMLKKN